MTAVDVGDAFELTFTTTAGATVAVSWYDPDLVPVYESVSVPEKSGSPGVFPRTFIATSPGMWKALFTASGTATQVEEHWVRATSVTGPAPLAATGDVTALYGDLNAAQEGLVKYLLRAASRLVRKEYPAIDAQRAAGTLDRDVVAFAVATMVQRVLRNPRGLRGESIGPFSYTYDTQVAAGELAIGPGETRAFSPRPSGDQVGYAFGSARITAGLGPPPCPPRWPYGW